MEDAAEINHKVKENKETLDSRTVVIREKLLTDLIEQTKSKHIGSEGEFQVFLLGKDGVAEKSVEVGIPHKSGVMASGEQIIDKLRPEIEEGYEIIADYHNHTEESCEVYKANDMPVEYATAPSSGDMDLDVPREIQTALKQKQYPRLIGLYIESQDRVIFNGFTVLREPTKEETDSIYFEDPLYQKDKPDELGIRLLPAGYTDPSKLQSLNIIQTVNIESVDNGGQHSEISNVSANL